MINSSVKLITLPFHSLVHEWLGISDNVVIEDRTLAALIQLADEEENTVHIEMPGDLRVLDHPIMWRIHAWRNASVRLYDLKKSSELSRRVSILESEVYRSIVEQLRNQFGNFKDSHLIAMAKKLIEHPEAAVAMGIELDNTKLQEALQEVKDYEKGKKSQAPQGA